MSFIEFNINNSFNKKSEPSTRDSFNTDNLTLNKQRDVIHATVTSSSQTSVTGSELKIGSFFVSDKEPFWREVLILVTGAVLGTILNHFLGL